MENLQTSIKSPKLKIYSGDKHPHEAQNLKTLELKKLNSKNMVAS